MIMILGSTHDDILYFESVMVNKKSEMIFDKYKCQIGTIFNQEVILVWDLYTCYESSLITSYIIEKYFVILIFVVGKCIAFSDNLTGGDIAISRRIMIGDVNQVKEANVRLGQIPNFPHSFESDPEVIKYLTASVEKRSFSKYELCVIVSTNVIMDSRERIKNIEMGGYVLGHNRNVVCDCTSGGVAIAGHLLKVPVISVKVVERGIDEKYSTETYLRVLKHYSDVGKSIVTCIGDIGRNDIIRGE